MAGWKDILLDVLKLLMSAVANTENVPENAGMVDPEGLFVVRAWVDEVYRGPS